MWVSAQRDNFSFKRKQMEWVDLVVMLELVLLVVFHIRIAQCRLD